MPSNLPSGAPLAHPVIQRFFDISVYFLLLTGFAMLAGASRLDTVSVIVALSALLGRGYLLLRQSEVQIPERWTSYLTLAYVAFLGLDYLLLSHTFIGARGHLLLFPALVRCL